MSSRTKVHLVSDGRPICGAETWESVITWIAADIWPDELTCKRCQTVKRKSPDRDGGISCRGQRILIYICKDSLDEVTHWTMESDE